MKQLISRSVVLALFVLVAAAPLGAPAHAATVVDCQDPQLTPTKTVYLPNVTKTLGGPSGVGWETPFIVQNVGTTSTTLEISFYYFTTGQRVACRRVENLLPGTSFDLQPNKDAALPDNTQFSVVVRSHGAPIVGVVNEIAGSGDRFEASSYVGVSSGATSVFLPNIAKRYFGWVTRFVIQNLGTKPTVASASFISFDGTKTATITRSLSPGQSQFIDPNVEPSLVDGTQYAVTVTSSEPIAVRVGTQNDDPGVAHPVLHATMGIATGASSIYGPYAVKNVAGTGKGLSTVVLQNLSTAPADLSLTFTPLGGGTPTTFTKSAVPARSAWDFDPRFQFGNAKATPQVLCGATASTGCLANGEYSFVASTSTSGAQLAAVVNVVGDVTGDTTTSGYAAVATPTAQLFLPNVTKTLGGANGWTTPPILQNTTASAATVTLTWNRFSDGQQMMQHVVTIPAASSVRLDPRDFPALPDNTQFAIRVDGGSTALAGIVTELNYQGGDGAMGYEAFGPLQGDPVRAGNTRVDGKVTTSTGQPAAGVCIKIGPVPNCTTFSDQAGNYAYELPRDYAVSYTFYYLVNGVEKARQSISGPFTSDQITLPTMALQP